MLLLCQPDPPLLSLASQSRNGLILNLGSFAALTNSPLLAPYAGTKAFLQTWSQALSSELEGKGVDCWLVNTYFVVSIVVRACWMEASSLRPLSLYSACMLRLPSCMADVFPSPSVPFKSGLKPLEDPQSQLLHPVPQHLRPFSLVSHRSAVWRYRSPIRDHAILDACVGAVGRRPPMDDERMDVVHQE